MGLENEVESTERAARAAVAADRARITRREAREALPYVKGPAERGLFPDARVVRVSVLIQVEGD